jgi:hypothetical protein
MIAIRDRGLGTPPVPVWLSSARNIPVPFRAPAGPNCRLFKRFPRRAAAQVARSDQPADVRSGEASDLARLRLRLGRTVSSVEGPPSRCCPNPSFFAISDRVCE